MPRNYCRESLSRAVSAKEGYRAVGVRFADAPALVAEVAGPQGGGKVVLILEVSDT
jgi:hypothetical protein